MTIPPNQREAADIATLVELVLMGGTVNWCTATARSGEPCRSLAGSDGRCPQHVGVNPTHGQPLLADGTVDVRLLVKRWDEAYNAHAGPKPPDERATGEVLP